MTVTWGANGFLVIRYASTTTRALWLTIDERALAQSRLARSGTTTQEPVKGKLLWACVRALITSPLAYLFLAAYLQFAWSQRANSYFLLYLEGLRGADGHPLYSVYTVNLIPLGGYSISIVSNVALNALSDWKNWRWQVAIDAALVQLVATSVLAAWPGGRATIMTFYFLTFATAGWGYALLSSSVAGHHPAKGARSTLGDRRRGRHAGLCRARDHPAPSVADHRLPQVPRRIPPGGCVQCGWNCRDLGHVLVCTEISFHT